MPREKNDPKADAAWLLDMLTAAKAVSLFITDRTFNQYITDLMLRSAVERQVEIIGEAARGLSDAFKSLHPDIPWRAIMAQRNRLAHEYGEIDDALIWTVATIHIKKLIDQIEPLIPPPPTESSGS